MASGLATGAPCVLASHSRIAPLRRRPIMKGALPRLEEWSGEDTTLAEIEDSLARLRDESDLRTSVMTHTAWVPEEWLEAAREALAGLAERHPSRTIILVP